MFSRMTPINADSESFNDSGEPGADSREEHGVRRLRRNQPESLDDLGVPGIIDGVFTQDPYGV